ncbi:MAG TPA: tetratricopeptide repeat protein [Terriglobia bacterium]|nr:tetratricopeptide repeat protein [Terriglobia bacterium]
MRHICLKYGLLLASLLLAAPSVGAQQLGQVLQQGLSSIEKQQWIIAGQVKNLRGEPVANARIQVHYASEGISQHSLEASFQGKYSLTLELDTIAYTTLTVTVSAQKAGYLPAREIVTFNKRGVTYPIDLVMLPEKPDVTTFPLDQLLADLAPRCQAAGALGLKPESARQDFSRGVDLFFSQKDPAKAFPLLSAAAKAAPRCVECKTILGLVDLQYGGLAGAQQEFAEAALVKLSPAEEPRKVNAFLLLGVITGWSGEYSKAAGLLMQALALAPQDPLVLQELGRTLVNQKNWEAADEYLQKAVKAGASPEAHLLRCRALLEEGGVEEADAEMRAYLGGRDIRDQPQPTRLLYTQVQSQISLLAYRRANPWVDEALPQLLKDIPDLAGLVPVADQAPLDSILQKTGLNVEAFFRGFQNATSHERIDEQQIGKGGKVRRSLQQTFQYLLLAAPFQDGISLDEYRTNLTGAVSAPSGLGDGFMLTAGFASAAVLFHPAYQPGGKFKLLGQAEVDGVPCHVVAFAQVPEKAKTYGRFSSNSATALVLHQGIAWIDTADSRIVRLRTDLLQPLPSVRLQRETTEIRYALVKFKETPAPVSLPTQVTVTVQWKSKAFRNLHQYTDFRLFNTEAQEKRQALSPPPAAAPSP